MKKVALAIIILVAVMVVSAQLNIHSPWQNFKEYKGGKILCFASLGKVVFAATSKQIYVSDSNGRGWENSIDLPKGVTAISAIAVSDGWLVINTPQGVFVKMIQRQQFMGY